MALVYTPQPVVYAFEAAVVRELARLPGSGFIAHNMLLPKVRQRSNPNEHDIVLLLPHAAYTIDAKNYEPGEYRLPGNSPVEWRKAPPRYRKHTAAEGNGPDAGGARRASEEWRSCRSLPNPFHVAYEKQNVLRTFMKEVDPSLQSYAVESLIVIPDHAEVVPKLHRGGEGDAPFRLRILKLRELVDSVKGDDAGLPGIYRPPLEKLEKVFEDLQATPRAPGECSLAGVRIKEPVDRSEPGCPVTMTAFRGRHEMSRCKVDVHLYQKWPWGPEADRFLRHCRRRLRALYRTRARRVPRIVAAEEMPDVVVVAFLSYSGESVRQLLRRRGPLDEAVARALVRELCTTLRELHDDRIVHLGLNSDHVLVGPELERHGGRNHQIIGFTNPMIDTERITTQALRTGLESAFSAPEMQYAGHPDRARPTCDVFALGMLLAMLMLGEEEFVRRLEGPGPPCSGLPTRVARVIEDAVTPRVAHRIPSCQELARRL